MALEKKKHAVVLLLITMLIASSAAVLAAEKGASLETLKQYVADLKKSPENAELREKDH